MYTWFTWLLVVVVAVIIVGGSWRPGDQKASEWCDWEVSMGIKQPDKLKHFGGFLLFGASLTLALVGRNNTPLQWRVISFLCLVGVGLGVATEAIQPSLGRTCDVNDLIADIAGLIAGWGLIWVAWWLCGQWQRRRPMP